MSERVFIDANLTTLIAGIVMFWLGSGPVKGFAITLSLGVHISAARVAWCDESLARLDGFVDGVGG